MPTLQNTVLMPLLVEFKQVIYPWGKYHPFEDIL